MHRAGAMRNDLFQHGQTARELSRGAGINYRMLKAESFSKLEARWEYITLKPTEDCLTGSVVLALMNWMSKGDRATAPFSQELSKSECVNGALW
jgi:hypothetical protein